MSEAHRYKAVKLLTEAGNKISYAPHGPWMVPASDYDTLRAANQRLEGEVKALREALQAIYDCDYQAPHDASDTVISDSKKRCIFLMRKLAEAALRGNGGE